MLAAPPNSWITGMTDWILGSPSWYQTLIGMAGARCILGLVSAFWWMRLGPRTSSNPLMDRTMSCIDFLQGAWAVPEQLFVYLWVEPDPGPCDGQGQDPVRLRDSEGHLPLSWLSLCPCRAACLAWGVPGLGLSGYWAHLKLGANKLERIPKWHFQHQWAHGRKSYPKWLLPVSTSPGYSHLLYTSLGLSKIKKYVWPRLFSIYFFCPGSLSMWDSGCSL